MATGRIGTTPVLTTRWSKAPAGGTTSLSGLDDNSVSLVYSVGYEAVYRNGVLLSRGNDYTATNGTSITLTDATIAGDIIEVFANQTIPLTDTYSQTVSDGRFIKNTLTTTTGDIIYASAANTPARLGIGSTDQVLKVSGGIPAWGAAPAPTFTGCVLTNSVSTSTTNNTYHVINFDTEKIDTDGYHSTSTNTNRITIPTGKGGKYLITAAANWAANTTGIRYLYLSKNNTTPQSNTTIMSIAGPAGINAAISAAGSIVVDLAVGDWISMECYQNSGGALNVFGDNQDVYITNLTATYLGA